VIDSAQVSGSAELPNFVFLIDSTVPDWRHTSFGGHVGKLDGTDIYFTSDEGGFLSHELEHYNPATGHVVAWVEHFGLSATDDTTIYMYYGNAAAADQQQVAVTWSDAYTGRSTTLHDSFSDSSGSRLSAQQRFHRHRRAGRRRTELQRIVLHQQQLDLELRCQPELHLERLVQGHDGQQLG
jgi:hypothetical protein